MTIKVCMDCFNKRFPHKMPSIYTWGRQCADCKKPCASRGLLIKIDVRPNAEPPQDVGVVAVDMRHKL
ncbi:hypothetical protein HWB99_gp107 [Mycobacterium phage DrLupo]|uniref:Uncharacterized protein n=1 Tax=Mycobacterium phage DrLupo TaxID=2499037 RepID=A0A3S9UQT1_9CAUD|nr:hypothetical protein HWB99_gp107 [Mycobacterium phage DrLupo]AZS12643.1 hypothetical protein SEA_DRLUPO_107 [Mycobacterium phage DrLupo]